VANIKKRGDTYRIRVSCGYDTKGKQVMASKTWKPPDGMSEKRAEKEAQRIAVLFEEECKGGVSFTSVKFGTFIDQWFEECANIQCKEQTLRSYGSARKRAKDELGHLGLNKITQRDIQRFIRKLVDTECENRPGKLLSSRTIRNTVYLVSSVFEYAVGTSLISKNPCKGVVFPDGDSKSREMYTQEEAQHFLDLLMSSGDEHNFQYIVCFILAIYTGFRRGELLGLEWRDFNDGLVSVRRAAYYSSRKGHYTDKPKTKASMQTQKLPDVVWQLLLRYREHQAAYASSLGDKWISTGRLFTAWNGGPINVDSPLRMVHSFCDRHGLRHVTLHSFRHLYASLLIYSGLDVKTVQVSLRHASATTTLNIYTHEFDTARARASAAVGDSLNLTLRSKQCPNNDQIQKSLVD
jgi:integrase